jgi:hypothetical protein
MNRRVPLTKLFETIKLPEQLPAAAIKRLFMSSTSIIITLRVSRVCIKLPQRREAVIVSFIIVLKAAYYYLDYKGFSTKMKKMLKRKPAGGRLIDLLIIIIVNPVTPTYLLSK